MSTDAPEQNLAARQRWLYRVITQGDAGCDLGGKVSGGKISPARRIGVYRHAYVHRLVQCLRDDFPGVEAALGAEAFEAHCRRYVAEHPPHVTLNEYGARFPAFLADACGGFECPTWAVELATLEWATVRAIHADAREILGVSQIASIAEYARREVFLALGPTVQLLHFEHEVNAFLTELLRPRAVGLADDDAVAPSPIGRPSWVLVCRRGRYVERLELASWAHELLVALAAGCSLVEAMATTCARHPELGPGEVSGQFRGWVEHGVFSGLRFTEQPADTTG